MSKHFDKWLKYKASALVELDSIFTRAIEHGWHSREITYRWNSFINSFLPSDAPGWVKSELQGAKDTWRRVIDRYHLVFIYQLPCGQRFEVCHQGDPHLYPSTRLRDPSEFADAPGWHVWKHNANPYFIMEKMQEKLNKLPSI